MRTIYFPEVTPPFLHLLSYTYSILKSKRHKIWTYKIEDIQKRQNILLY